MVLTLEDNGMIQMVHSKVGDGKRKHDWMSLIQITMVCLSSVSETYVATL